jgi:hypothetical protein
MSAFQAVALLFASLLPQQEPRIDDMPMRVCAEAARAIFQVENRADTPLYAVISVERWSDEGDPAGWEVVQPDITQRDARRKPPRSLTIEPRRRQDVVWELKKRVGLPALATGRHRLVVSFSFEPGEPTGTVTHEFLIVYCGD